MVMWILLKYLLNIFFFLLYYFFCSDIARLLHNILIKGFGIYPILIKIGSGFIMNEVEETIRCIESSISAHYKSIDKHFERIDMLNDEKLKILNKYGIPHCEEKP